MFKTLIVLPLFRAAFLYIEEALYNKKAAQTGKLQSAPFVPLLFLVNYNNIFFVLHSIFFR